MAVMIVAHPIPGFSGHVRVEDVGLSFIGGFTGPTDVPAGIQAQLTGAGYTLNATPAQDYGDKYLTAADWQNPNSAFMVAQRAASVAVVDEEDFAPTGTWDWSGADVTGLAGGGDGGVVLPSSTYALTAPAGLSWDFTTYPLTASLVPLPDGRTVAQVNKRARDFFDVASTARTAPARTFYVNSGGARTIGADAWGAGLDTNNGTSFATPFLSISKALTAVNAGTTPAAVYVAFGLYPQTLYPSLGNVSTQVDVALIAVGGRVVTGAWDDAVTFAADATHTSTYKTTAALADCTSVMWLDLLTRDGHYGEGVQVATPALCNITPGSWCLSGTDLYVHRPDGTAPTVANTRVYRKINQVFRIVRSVAPPNVFIGGADANSGFDFEGGYSGVLTVSISGDYGVNRVLAVENSTFRYAPTIDTGGGVISTARGVNLGSWRGLAVFENCDASANGTDGFNAHSTRSANRNQFLLTINCTGINNGRNQQSSNGWSIHENMVGIDLAGRYERSRGGAVRNINDSLSWMAGTAALDDLGDKAAGGSVAPTAFRVDDQAVMWVDRVLPRVPASGVAYAATGTAVLHKRNVWPTGQRDYLRDTGLIDAY